jgi:hypothetical protein
MLSHSLDSWFAARTAPGFTQRSRLVLLLVSRHGRNGRNVLFAFPPVTRTLKHFKCFSVPEPSGNATNERCDRSDRSVK